MWKNYSRESLRYNRASRLTILAASFIAAFFLSFLCSSFYQIWADEIDQIIQEEGAWQGRLTGAFTEEDLVTMRRFANVKEAVVNKTLSGDGNIVVDLIFEKPGRIFEDMPLMAKKLEISEERVEYHLLLLSRYLIHDPQEPEPPLLLTFYLLVLMGVSLSLVLIIHNSFAVSLNGRIHQFGILSSIGATPGQIRICILQEAAMLAGVPILFGVLLGNAATFGVVFWANGLAEELAIRGGRGIVFRESPLVIAVSFGLAALTVLISAWIPAWRLGRMSPLAAIRNTGELTLKRKKRSPILGLLFGVEGELAGNALKAQKKALRTTTLSLTLSFLGFTLVLCFFTLSGISTRYTYFARYAQCWDVMAEIPDVRIVDFLWTEKLSELRGARETVVYQKADAYARIPEERFSEELRSLGGLYALTGKGEGEEAGERLVDAPLVILDDAAFLSYCEQIGAGPELDGVIVLNQIWDSLHSNFRYPSFLPFLREDEGKIRLESQEANQEGAEVPVLAYTQEAPLLREEYPDYALVQFVPVSLWKEIAGAVGGEEARLSVRILGEEGAGLADMKALEHEVTELLGGTYEAKVENRIQERMNNDRMIAGYQLLLGGFCVILALIGIANVFSNTLGFLRQRKREFAQYQSVGMTPEGLRKLFCIEALVIAGRPVLITCPVAVAILGFMIKKSYLDPMEFVREAPFAPILAFILAVFGFVALAYYLGGRKVLRCPLAEALRDDFI